jgi:hypothetical protein
MAYLKNGSAEDALEFLLFCYNTEELNESQYGYLQEKMELLQPTLSKQPIAKTTEDAKNNFLAFLPNVPESYKNFFICLFSVILNVDMDLYVKSKEIEDEKVKTIESEPVDREYFNEIIVNILKDNYASAIEALNSIENKKQYTELLNTASLARIY